MGIFKHIVSPSSAYSASNTDSNTLFAVSSTSTLADVYPWYTNYCLVSTRVLHKASVIFDKLLVLMYIPCEICIN